MVETPTTIPEIITTIPEILTTIPEKISALPEILNTILKIFTTIPDILITTTIPENIITTIPENTIKTTTLENIIKTTIPEKIITTIITSQKVKIPEDKEKCSYKDIYENKCENELTNEQIQEVYSQLRQVIKKGEFNSTNNKIYQTKNAVFQISTIKEQQSGKYSNISSIDFDECEKIIKKEYNIKDEDDLLIFKTDFYNNDSSIVYVQYEIYNPYNYKYIPLDICSNVDININFPINLDDDIESLYLSLSNDGYNLFDSNDSFYNDICTTYTTQNGTDITLLDRKQLIYDNNKNVFLCQEGCEFISYNETTKKSKCNCNVQKEESITDIKQIKFTKEEIVDNFLMSSLKHSNFKVIKCYKLIFSKKGQIKNIGSFLLWPN